LSRCHHWPLVGSALYLATVEACSCLLGIASKLRLLEFPVSHVIGADHRDCEHCAGSRLSVATTTTSTTGDHEQRTKGQSFVPCRHSYWNLRNKEKVKRDFAPMAQYLTQCQSRCDCCAETAYLVGTPHGLWCGRCWRLWVSAQPQSRAFPSEFREAAWALQATRASRVADQIAAAQARQVALDRVRARVIADSLEEPEPEPEPKRRRYVTCMQGHRRLE
jgi:hypothetical protein